MNGAKSGFFAVNIGVSKGKIYFRFYFLFLNDFEQYFEDNSVESLDMINNISDDVLDTYLKILILLYADDTVLISETVDGMQHMLNVFSDYCNTWKLHVNIDKNKVVIFSSRRDKTNVKFTFNDSDLEV